MVVCLVTLLQRFIPSEFGLDPDKVQILNMDYDFYSRKAEIRRLIEAEGIPYTIVSCNFFTSYLLPSLVQPGMKSPPRDKVTIFGDGNTKGLSTRNSLLQVDFFWMSITIILDIEKTLSISCGFLIILQVYL